MAGVKAQLDALEELWLLHGRDALNAEHQVCYIDKMSADRFKEYYRTISEYVHAESYAISHLIRGYGVSVDDTIYDWDIVREYEIENDKYKNLSRLEKKRYEKEEEHFATMRKNARLIINRAYKQYMRVKIVIFGKESTWDEVVIDDSFPDLKRCHIVVEHTTQERKGHQQIRRKKTMSRQEQQMSHRFKHRTQYYPWPCRSRLHPL